MSVSQSWWIRDFLNIPSSNKSPIEPHCWHLFVPKYLGQDRTVVLGDYLDTMNFEDPARDDHEPEYELYYIPKIFDFEADFFNVTETNIDLKDRLDLSTIRAVRDADGNPVHYNSHDETILNISKNVTVDAKISSSKNSWSSMVMKMSNSWKYWMTMMYHCMKE